MFPPKKLLFGDKAHDLTYRVGEYQGSSKKETKSQTVGGSRVCTYSGGGLFKILLETIQPL